MYISWIGVVVMEIVFRKFNVRDGIDDFCEKRFIFSWFNVYVFFVFFVFYLNKDMYVNL